MEIQPNFNKITAPLNEITVDNKQNTNKRKFNRNQVEMDGFFDTLIQIFNDFPLLHNYHKSYWFFQYFPQFIQMLLLSYLPNISELWMNGGMISKIIHYFSFITSFSPCSTGTAFNVIPGLFFSIIYFLIFGYFILLYFIQIKLKIHNKTLISITAFVSQILTPLFFIPLSIHIGFCFNILIPNPIPSLVIIFMIEFIGYVLCLICNYFCSMNGSFLLNPNCSLVAAYNGNHAIFSVFVFSLINEYSLWMVKTQKYLFIIALAIHIGFLVYLTFDLFTFQYVHNITQTVFAGLNCSIISGHILTCFTVMNVKISMSIRLAFPISVFFISCGIFYFVFTFIRKNIIKKLTPPVFSTEAEKIQYFDSLSIPIYSLRKVKSYLNIGFTALPPSILDFSFITYICNKSKDYEIWNMCALFCAFFPNEQQIQKYFIEGMSQFSSKSIREKFNTYHLKSLYIKRYFSSSEESGKLYENLQSESADAEISIKSFWKSISEGNYTIHQIDIENLAIQLNNCKRNWKNAIDQFPNDSRFSSGYADFLLRTLVSVEKGALMKIKCAHLMKGLLTDVDSFFKAFAIARPFIIKKKICDKTGNIRKSSIDITSANQTTAVSTTALQKLEEDIDSGAADKLICDTYEWPHLRRSLSRATSNYNPPYLHIAIIGQIFGILLWFFVSISAIIYAFNIMQNFNDISSRMNNIYDFRTNIAVAKITISILWAKSGSYSFSDSLFSTYINEEAQAEPQLYNPLNPSSELQRFLILASDTSINITKSFSKALFKSKDPSKIIEGFNNPTTICDICKSDGSVHSSTNISIKDAMSSVIYNYLRFAGESNSFNNFGSSIRACQSYNLHNHLSESLDNLINLTIEDLNTSFKSGRNIIVIFLSVLIILFFLCGVSLCLPLIVSAYSLNKLMKALLSVDSETARTASHSVIKTETETEVHTGILHPSQSAHITTMQLFYYFIIQLIILVLLLIGTIIPINQLSHLQKLIQWSQYSARRFPLAIESVAELGYYLNGQISGSISFSNTSSVYQRSISYLESMISTEVEFYSGDSGIKGKYSDIDTLHEDDFCDVGSGNSNSHELYKCFSFERLISTFTMLIKSYLSNTATMNGDNWIQILHMISSEIYNVLFQSQQRLDAHINSAVSKGQLTIVFCFIIIFILYIIMVTTMDLSIHRGLKIAKTCLILLRHIPPPAIAENKIISGILLGNSSEQKESERGAANVAFENLPTPSICISADCTIEAMNGASKQLFGYFSGQIVGQKLDCLIEKFDADESDSLEAGNEIQTGSYELYKAIHEMNEGKCNEYSVTHRVSCRCADDSLVICEVTIHAVVEFSGIATNFVLFIRDIKEETIVDAKIQETRDSLAKLKNQLIPRDVQGFIRDDHADFSFTTPNATVVALTISDFWDKLKTSHKEHLSSTRQKNSIKSSMKLTSLGKSIGIDSMIEKSIRQSTKLVQNDTQDQVFENENDFFHQVHEFFLKLEGACMRNPPMIKHKIMVNTMIAICGLFSEKGLSATHGQTAIAFANEAKDLANQDGWKLSIGIATGGPLLCGLVNNNPKSFEVASDVIEEAIELASISGSTRILVSAATKDIASDSNYEILGKIGGKDVFVLK